MAADQYDDTIDAAAHEWNVDPVLLKSVMLQESRGNARAVSRAGARGLMQLMPDTAAKLGVTDINDPVQSIYGGAKYLSEALDAEGNPDHALLYYHGGPGWRQRYGAESAGYVPGVAGYYRQLSQAKANDQAPAESKPVQLAQANTGTATDASPAPAPGKDPSQMSDAEWLDWMGQTYPSMRGPNADQAKPATAKPATDATPGPAKVNDDDFLKSTGAATPGSKGNGTTPAATKPQGGSDVSSDDAFLKSTGAAVASSGGQQTQKYRLSSSGEMVPVSDQPTTPPPGSSTEPGPGIPSVIAAGKNAFASSGHLLSPMATDWLGRQGFLGQVGLFGARLADTGWADVNALYAGGQEAGKQALSTVLPESLAETIVHAPDAFAGSPHMMMPVGPPKITTPEAASNPLTWVRQSFSDGGAGAPAAPPPVDPLAARVAEVSRPPAPSPVAGVPPVSPELAAKPAAGPTSAVPPEGAPQPQSVGAAAAPSGSSLLTPREEAAYRSTAEGSKLLETQQPGIPDTNAYVRGVQPNQAEIEQTVNAAREMKQLNLQSTEVSQSAKEIAAANNEARQAHFDQLAGSKVQLDNEIAARQAQADSDLKATWRNKQPADVQPVLDQVEALKQTEDWQRPAVRNAVNDAVKELYDSDGNLITDPQRLYGARKAIDDQLSSAGKRANPASERAQSQLLAIKSTLDQVIEQAAPGFRQYLDNFSNASKRIDEMGVLQDFRHNIVDAQGRMTFSKVQRMMRDIVDSRSASGINPYKSISDETMQQLWNLRDDLRRTAGAQELARTPGSDTAQNLVDALKIYGKLGGTAAMHTAAASLLGPAAPLVLERIGAVIKPVQAARAQRRIIQRGQQMLNPLTPLQSPGGAP